MALNSKQNRQKLIDIYPELGDDPNFEILSEKSKLYNCIAWAMHCQDRWVAPDYEAGHWWPEGVADDFTPQSLVDAFVAVGFEVAENGDPEIGYNKVALYKGYSRMLGYTIWTHAARVVAPGILHSKFGDAFDGKHSSGSVKKTTPSWIDYSYGEIFRYMKRKTTIVTPEITEGSISVDMSKIDL